MYAIYVWVFFTSLHVNFCHLLYTRMCKLLIFHVTFLKRYSSNVAVDSFLSTVLHTSVPWDYKSCYKMLRPPGSMYILYTNLHMCRHGLHGHMRAQGSRSPMLTSSGGFGTCSGCTPPLVGCRIHMLVEARLNTAMGTSSNVLPRV